MNFQDIDLMEVGHSIQLVGGIYHDAKNDRMLLACFPEEKIDSEFDESWRPLNMNVDEWSKFLLQGDILETHSLVKEQDGKISKAILRKSQRQIEQGISWKVYRRDNFTCRYCGVNDVPLTVDHIILWEKGGPSTEDNLLSACRKCNRLRGNTDYVDWIESPEYHKRSQNISALVRRDNIALIATLDRIPRYIKPRSR